MPNRVDASRERKLRSPRQPHCILAENEPKPYKGDYYSADSFTMSLGFFVKVFRRSETIRYLMNPSAAVADIVASVRDGPHQHMIALHIRTGMKERNKFLEPGDEERFVYCVDMFLKLHQKIKKTGDVAVFVASDSEVVKRKVGKLMKGIEGVTLKQLENSSIHASKEVQSGEDVERRLQMTAAEFHLIGGADTAFTTQDSLFSAIAREVGPRGNNGTFKISSSACDSPTRKGYITCAEPRNPSFCSGEVSLSVVSRPKARVLEAMYLDWEYGESRPFNVNSAAVFG